MSRQRWEPALPIRKYDNLISAPQFKNLKPFVPSYEADSHINMNFLMGNEYFRIWFNEKGKWAKLQYPASESKGGGGNEVLKRKYVLRTKKKTNK